MPVLFGSNGKWKEKVSGFLSSFPTQLRWSYDYINFNIIPAGTRI